MIILNYLAKNLFHIRKLFDYTQEEMGKYMEVSRTTWANWENKVSAPDVPKVIDIAQQCKLKIDDLLLTDLSQEPQLTEHLSKSKQAPAPEKNSVLNESDIIYTSPFKKKVELLILSQLNDIAEDVAYIKKKLP